MFKQGLSTQEVDMAMQYVEKFMNPVFIAGSALISNIVMGTVVSLILAIFLKKDAAIPEF